jgi:hypothetical protein
MNASAVARSVRSFVLPALLASLSAAVTAQCFDVRTAYTGTAGQKGTMFDVVIIAAAPLTVFGLEQLFWAAGVADVEVYTRAGSWVGNQDNPAAWNLLGRVTNLPVLAPAMGLTPIPLGLAVTIAPGATQGFYVTTTSASTAMVAFEPGVNQIGLAIGGDANIAVQCGIGKGYVFAASYGLPTNGRQWRGKVRYSMGNAACALAANTTFGTGCGTGAFDSFYRDYPNAIAAAADLTGNAVQFVATSTGYVGLWLPGAAAMFVPPTAAATVLPTGNDGVVAHSPSMPLSTPYGAVATLQISGNGIIGFGPAGMTYPGTSSWTPTRAGLLNGAAGGFYAWHDYNAAEPGSGPILVEEIAGVLYVTWNGVENYSTPAAVNRSTLQFQIGLATGNCRIVFVQVDGNPTSAYGSATLVGVSAPGPSNDRGPVDLTQFPTTVSPELVPARMVGVTRPRLGTNWTLEVRGMSALCFAGVTVIGFADPALDLGFLGAPGCVLHATLELVTGFIPTLGLSAVDVPIPASPALAGVNLYATSGLIEIPPANALGWITTNGVQGTLNAY